MFKQDPPKNMRPPLEKNHLPELDDTELLNDESIQHYLAMIGQLQWLVTLGNLISMHKLLPYPDSGQLQGKVT